MTHSFQWSHVVLYRTNPNNPQAAGRIIEEAYRLRETIFSGFSADTFKLHAARIPPANRAVGDNDFQVMLTCMFKNRWYYEQYMKDSTHLRFVRFVLRGWMIKGSTAKDPQAEFIDYILNAGPDSPPIEWARNPAISENEVVWAGEKVYDAFDENQFA